ncbi:hypothetical protein MCOR16_011545 [Pyricularia oryzae]|nr:hypothetical protein MCOR16_011545 [Pyricularia oryzae]
MARPTNPEKHKKQRKKLVRKRGGSLMKKAEQLGKLGETFVLAVVFDPLYGYDSIVHTPKGFKKPNIKKPSRRIKRRCPHSSSQRQKQLPKSQEPVLDEITIEANDGSYLQEDDGDSPVEENGNQKNNKLPAYSIGTSETDAPHVDNDFKTLFGQIDFCNEPKMADFQPVKTQASTIKRRIVGVRLKDGRFIPKGSLNMGSNTLSGHRVN